jgi:hypothetical protein
MVKEKEHRQQIWTTIEWPFFCNSATEFVAACDISGTIHVEEELD